VLTMFSQTAYAKPSEYPQLKDKFSRIKALKFHFKEEDFATGGSIEKDGKLVRNTSVVSADGIVALGGLMRATAEISALSNSWKTTGTIIADKNNIYIHEVRGGRNNPPSLTKKSRDYAQRQIDSLASASPKFAKLKDRPICLPFQRLFYLNQIGNLWSPLDLYSTLDKYTVEDQTSNEDRAAGVHRWSVAPAENGTCSRVELFIDSTTGMLKRYVSYNPYKGFTDRVQHVGEFSNIEINPNFQEGIFDFKQSDFPDSKLRELDPTEGTAMFVNTFATPPKLIFESLFSEKAENVEELSGTGAAWFNSNHHIRFRTANFPKMKDPVELTEGEPSKAQEYFLSAFPKDAEILKDKGTLALKEFHIDKKHWWVLHNPKQKVFYVRHWCDE